MSFLKNRFSPCVEALEKRELMAANLTASLLPSKNIHAPMEQVSMNIRLRRVVQDSAVGQVSVNSLRTPAIEPTQSSPLSFTWGAGVSMASKSHLLGPLSQATLQSGVNHTQRMPWGWSEGQDKPGTVYVGQSSSLGYSDTPPSTGIDSVHSTWVGMSVSLDNQTTRTVIADLQSGATWGTISNVLSNAFQGQNVDVSKITTVVENAGWLPMAAANLAGHGITIETIGTNPICLLSQ
jgi:hypothetical protein